MKKIKVTSRDTDGDAKRGRQGKKRRRKFGAEASQVRGKVGDLDALLVEAEALGDLR